MLGISLARTAVPRPHHGDQGTGTTALTGMTRVPATRASHDNGDTRSPMLSARGHSWPAPDCRFRSCGASPGEAEVREIPGRGVLLMNRSGELSGGEHVWAPALPVSGGWLLSQAEQAARSWQSASKPLGRGQTLNHVRGQTLNHVLARMCGTGYRPDRGAVGSPEGSSNAPASRGAKAQN
jgi:hypothetical protein